MIGAIIIGIGFIYQNIVCEVVRNETIKRSY